MNSEYEKELIDFQSVQGLADNLDLDKKGRRFILKDELVRLKKIGPAKYPYWVFLFNDVIVFAERSPKKATVKYISHWNVKDILFIECTDIKEKYAFGIMHKGDKKKMKFSAKDEFARMTWRQNLEKQIEKYCFTDTTFTTGESMVVNGSPRNSWSSNMSDLVGSFSSYGNFEYESEGSSHDPSPPLSAALLSKDDYSSNGSSDEGSYEESDETKSDGDESECESKEIKLSDGSTISIFLHADLHTIMWWLVYYGDYGTESTLIKTFLHSSITFTTASDIFQNLMDIFFFKNPVPKVISVRYSLCDTRRRVTFFIRIWLEFFFDRDFFPDKALFTRLIHFFSELSKTHLHDANVLKLIIIRVNKKRLADKRLNRFHLIPTNQNASPAPSTKQLSSKSSLNHSASLPVSVSQETKLIDWNVTSIAEQFVLIEFALFKAVDLKEISNMAWKSEHPRKTAPNVINIFNRFDLVSQWAATEVVMAHSPKSRVQIIEKLIALAQKCLELRNYNSLMEIIAGLNRGSVQRMKKTWEVVQHTSRDTFKMLNSVVDPLQNYKNYRDQLRRAVSPCLPYFGIFLRDLTFMDVGNPVKIGENINFEKIYMTSKILKDIQMFQRTAYSFEEDDLQPLLRRLLAMPEEMLYKHSQTIEPSPLSISC